MEKYYPAIGDIFTMEDRAGVFVAAPGGYNREDSVSMSYDRGLCYIRLENLLALTANTSQLPETPLSNISSILPISGTSLPVFKQMDIAPFVFEKTIVYNVRQKSSKTVTVYE